MRTNFLISGFIAIILTSWMVVGSMIFLPDRMKAAEENEVAPNPSVRVRQSTAQPYSAVVTLRGKTDAAKSSVLKAEIGGRVQEIVAERGSRVQFGQTIISLDPENLPERLEAAQALYQQRRLEFEAAQKLQSTGFQSETRLAESESLYKQAQTELAGIRIALDNTKIRAPFDGVFNERLVELGEWVGVGDPVASFLQLDPMIVTAEATEKEIQEIDTGMAALARIAKTTIRGKIRYISKSANDAVRTYTVELEFDNPENRLQAGLTADIEITTASKMAHKVSPAVLFLGANTQGELGVKTVDDEHLVSFHQASILGTADDGVWVDGLPEQVTLITVGQGFVKPGLKVTPVDEASIQ